MEKVLSDKKAILFFVLPAFIILVAIIIVPIVSSLYYSTLDWDGIGKARFIGLQNFYELFIKNINQFHKTLLNTVILALLSVFVQLPIALFVALILGAGVKGEGFFRSVYFIPVIVSTVVIGQLWMKIYNPDYGLLNLLLKDIGLGSLQNEWIGNTKTALMAVFIPLVWQYIGYHMLLLYSSIKSIPADIMEAAKIDGASRIRTAFSITIPLITPMIEVCVTFAVVGSFKTFDLIYVLTNGGPMHATEVPTTLMYNMIVQRNMYGTGAAIAVTVVLECLLFTVLIQTIFKRIRQD